MVSTKKSNTKEFIQKAIKIHGAKFNYDKVNYKNSNIKVFIVCNDCENILNITPNNHLRGNGCAYCSKNKKYTTDTFIEAARKIHENSYNYIKVIYKGSKIKVCIICNTCNLTTI